MQLYSYRQNDADYLKIYQPLLRPASVTPRVAISFFHFMYNFHRCPKCVQMLIVLKSTHAMMKSNGNPLKYAKPTSRSHLQSVIVH